MLCKDFKQFATGLTNEVCQGAERLAQSLKRPFTYLNSSALSKEDLARKIAERDGIKEGLVAIFRCVEPCRTYKMRGNYQTLKGLEPHLELGKCLHLYFYVQHRRLGLLHLRLQTWFPFSFTSASTAMTGWPVDRIGKGWLRKADNRFTWLEDFHKAQALADRQLHTDWVSLCEQLRKRYHPLHEKIARPWVDSPTTGQHPPD